LGGGASRRTPADPSKVSGYARATLKRAGVRSAFAPSHDLRQTALTHTAASGAHAIYVQARAGHSQAAGPERYLHAAQVTFPGVVERAEAPLFGSVGVEVG
jgi:integrase